jgi:hypothetical protein
MIARKLLELINNLPPIDELDQLPMERLKQVYTCLNGFPPPHRPGRPFLCGNIAWMVQVIDSGKDPVAVRKKLVRMAERHNVSNNIRYMPGTRLVREWHGVTHEVIIEEKGYRWQRKLYRSLTRIASEITGAHWSGPRFFGLRNPSTE